MITPAPGRHTIYVIVGFTMQASLVIGWDPTEDGANKKVTKLQERAQRARQGTLNHPATGTIGGYHMFIIVATHDDCVPLLDDGAL